MTRREHITIVAAALAAGSTVMAKDIETMRELLEASQKDKKGVMLYMKGTSIGGMVVKIAGDEVELRSREYSRIIVKMAAIDAVAMS
jgi:hypothetical protein